MYHMIANLIPKSCIGDNHRVQSRFIWGDTEQRRKYHAVGWDTISRPQKNEGLGLRRLKEMNEAYILKIVRKLQVSTRELWCEGLRGKYKCDTNVDM